MDRRTFTAVLIGETALTADCATLLLERGHQVRGIVTSDPAIRRWAAQRGVTALGVDRGAGASPGAGAGTDAGPATDAAIEGFLADHPHDYLFSVANLRILTPAALGACAELPVNFHDALLPAGAGAHATTWALVDGARRHGVTWHVMTDEPDAGDVLQQRDVEIEPGETSFSLNVKCWQAGIESFGVLVDELSEGRATRTAQDPGLRTYHPRRKRPPQAMVVDWAESPADEIDAAVRATRFGPQDNEFGTVKLWLGDDAVVVTAAEASPAASSSSAPAGTVVGVDEDDAVLTVATRAGDLRITGLCTLSGQAVTAGDLAGRVRVGSTLPELPADLADALTAAHRDTIRHEADWVERLADVAPLDVPHRSTSTPGATTGAAGRAGLHVLDIEMPAVPTLLTATATATVTVTATAPDDGADEYTAAGRLVACLLAFLGRIAGPGAHDVGMRCATDPATPVLFATHLPLRIPAPRGDLLTYERQVRRQLDEVTARGSHLLDLPVRYAALAGGIAELPIVVELVDGFDQPERTPQAALHVQVTRDGRRCRWLVDTGAWPWASAEILRDSFVTFLRSVQDHDLDEATLVDDRERRALDRHNDTAAEYPRQRCVPQLFAEQARCQPSAPALTHGGQTLTYGELDRRVNQMADFLGRSGVGPGDLVGVHLDRSIDMVVALLGVLRAGAAYVPLDPTYPAARIVEMLADADVALLLTHSHLESDDIAAAVPEVVALDSRWPEIESVADDSPCDRASADTLAYVVYTSGSTGRLQGVRIGHRALTNLLWSMARAPGFTHEDSLLALSAICFDIAALELFLPLVTGGRVEIVPSDVAADGIALRRAVEEARPSVVQATPATWKILIAAGWTGHAGLRALCGGEALGPDLAAELTARAGAVWNVYGPTETTIWSAIGRVEPGEPVTLGRPIANTRLHVLDEAMRLLPRGVPGELHIGGDGVGAGYLHRPDLTGDRFRPDTFVSHPGPDDRLYRTGDLVRLGAGGDMELLGRIDHQVKARGFRVEPGDIESALVDHPEVARSVGVLADATRPAAETLPPDFTSDLALADDLLADLATTTATLPVLADPEHVLLTGATGFVGAFLLRELVRTTGATVHCLVRGQDRQQAFARLRSTLARYELWDEVSSADVAVVVGDLRRPDLGLEPAAFDELAQTVDAVFHAGAAVSWLHPYAELRAANVLGTEQVLRLAARARHRHRSIPVHHVSSMGVFARARHDGSRHGVDTPIGPPEGLVTGYQQTKWVAEHKLDAARQQGMPVSCYRVARVSGDSGTGACPADDVLWRILKGSMQVGGIPDHADMLLDLVPVDHVSAALVWLSRQPDTAGGTFHLSNSQLTSFRAVVTHLRGLGWPLPDVDRVKWAELVGADPGNAAHPLLDAFMATAWDPERVEIPLDPSSTLARLEGSGIECPPVDAALLDRYVGYFLRSGFLDRP